MDNSNKNCPSIPSATIVLFLAIHILIFLLLTVRADKIAIILNHGFIIEAKDGHSNNSTAYVEQGSRAYLYVAMLTSSSPYSIYTLPAHYRRTKVID